jgi:lysophospholipase L1-like esterase
MHTPSAIRPSTIATVLALVVVACGGGVDADTGAESTTTTATAAPITAAPSTTTSSTTTTTTTTQPPEPGLLLAFGDSFAAPTGWPSQYAALAGEELGKDLQVSGQVCALGCSDIIRVLARDDIRGELARADIVVVQPRAGWVFSKSFDAYLGGTCGGEDGRECIRTSLEEFRLYVQELLDTVLAPTDDDVVVRTAPAGIWAIDFFYPDLREDDPPTFAIFVESMVEYVRIVEAESAERCILMTDPSALFNGDDYLQRADSALLRDGAHPSDEGSRVIAEYLHSLGYEPTAQSC